MNVISNYLKNSKVLPRLKNTDFNYKKKLEKLEEVDNDIHVILNDSHLSSTLYDLGYYMQRVQERSGIPLPLWPWMRQNVVVPPSTVRNVDVILSRNLLPVQLKSEVPVVYETGFVPNDYVGASNYGDRREEVEHELHKIRRYDTYILKTEESVGRFAEAADAVAGIDIRDAVHYVPYFLPEVEPIDLDALDEKFSQFPPARILFVGADGERKGVHNFIEALNRLCEQYPDLREKVKVRVVTRDDLPSCRVEVDKHDYLSRGEVIRAFRKAHIFCMPTLKDAYGLVYVEAMASGCAVVADDSPVRQEILDEGKAGMLSNPSEPEDIADRLVTLLHSPSQAKTLAKRALRRFKSHYYWKPVGKKYVDLLRKAASSR